MSRCRCPSPRAARGHGTHVRGNFSQSHAARSTARRHSRPSLAEASACSHFCHFCHPCHPCHPHHGWTRSAHPISSYICRTPRRRFEDRVQALQLYHRLAAGIARSTLKCSLPLKAGGNQRHFHTTSVLEHRSIRPCTAWTRSPSPKCSLLRPAITMGFARDSSISSQYGSCKFSRSRFV